MKPQNPKLRERCINLAGTVYLHTKKRSHANKAGVTVLNYHRISGASFKKHLAYILSHYQILSPEFFFRWLDDKETVDGPSVLFTFDDAYLGFYEEIYPVLRQNDLSVFMFVPTGFIGTEKYFWEDELEVGFQNAKATSVSINGKKFFLYSRLYRTDCHDGILQYLRPLDPATRDEIKEDVLAQLGVDITGSQMNGYRFLDWPQIVEMEESGVVVFGSHTVNHENLASLSADAVRFELQESKRTLEGHIGKPVKAFAYPYGGQESFSLETAGAVRETGYMCAFTTVQGQVTEKRRTRFMLTRTMLFDYQTRGAVALKIDAYRRSRLY